jgi:EpsI family protein
MSDRHNSARFWSLLVVLIACGVVINTWQRAGEATVARSQLSEFPSKLGSWTQTGPDQRFDAATESVLRADDYIQRTYFMPDGRTASFYVGYYKTQRNGATYHSPLNCLPGAGWTMSDASMVTVSPAKSTPFQANRYLIQNGNDRQLMVYWYQGRGRAVASEYWGKIYTVIDSIKRRRSDGAMVRIAVPVTDSEQSAEKIALDLAARSVELLPGYVPN